MRQLSNEQIRFSSLFDLLLFSLASLQLILSGCLSVCLIKVKLIFSALLYTDSWLISLFPLNTYYMTYFLDGLADNYCIGDNSFLIVIFRIVL